MPPALQLRAADGRTFIITAPVRIGRDAACQIRIEDGLISRVHATVWAEGAALRVRDEGSSNGTFFNGERLEPGRVYNLRVGDEVRLGHTTLTVEPAPVGAFQPAPAPPAGPPPAPSAAERAAASAPPTLHMPAQARPAPAPAAPPAPPPARRRGALPVAGVAGCLIVCLVLVCGGGGLYAAQRPPLVQTALAQLGPSVPGVTPGTPAAEVTLAPEEIRLTVLPERALPTPLPPEAFAANEPALAEAVAELNRAQLDFINRALAQAHSPAPRLAKTFSQFVPITDADFAFLEQKGVKVAVFASQQGQTMAAQGGGNDPAAAAIADAYAAVAEQAYVFVVKVDALRNSWVDGSLALLDVAALMAQYSSALVNPAVTTPGTTGNPFVPFAADPGAILQPAAVDPADLALLTGDNSGSLVGWVAVAPPGTLETLTLPAGNGLPPAALDSDQLAALLADSAPPAPELLTSVATGFLGAQAAADGQTLGTVTVPNQPVVVANPAADGGQTPPTFPNGQVTIIKKGDDAGDSGVVGRLFGVDGTNTPTEQALAPVTAALPVVAISINNVQIASVTKRPKDAFNTFEADVAYSFDVQWVSALVAPQFELNCVSGNNFNVVSAVGSEHINAKGLLILYPGAEDAFCYASRNGNTLGSASITFLVGDSGEATQRAIQVETDSHSLDLTLTADTAGTTAAQQTQGAATRSADETSNAVGTEVAGTQAAEFNQTATALAANADRFATQTAAAATSGDDDKDGVTNANDRCFDQSETKNGWRDEDGCPDTLPIVNINFGFTENVQNGPLASFSSQANLIANFAGGTLSGSLSGGGSWNGTYNCINTSDPSDIYQIVDARYTASYTAPVSGSASGGTTGGTFQGTLTATGVTNIRMQQEFTHPECTHLNGTTTVDNWTGNGNVNGTWDGNTFASLTTSWTVDEVGFAGAGGGTVTLTTP